MTLLDAAREVVDAFQDLYGTADGDFNGPQPLDAHVRVLKAAVLKAMHAEISANTSTEPTTDR